jgi:hypothetical protein
VTANLHFCTLFDSRYATRGLTMLDSLARMCRTPHDVTILAMDDAVVGLLGRLGRPSWNVVEVPGLQDGVFTALERTRPRREFCWTAAPVLCKRMVDISRAGDIVVYVDADLMFFGEPEILLDELGTDGTILIHEHRFSPDRVQYEPTSGRFNVGFVAFRVGDEARRCTDRWRGQVIEKCDLDPDNGFCGDQGYLNEWPALYSGARIMQNIGGGTAPWNLIAYNPSGNGSRPSVNGKPLVFFHYHAFRMVEVKPFGLIAAQPAFGYSFPRAFNRLFFAHYAMRIRYFSALAHRAGFPVAADETVGLRDVAKGLLSSRYVLAAAFPTHPGMSARIPNHNMVPQ